MSSNRKKNLARNLNYKELFLGNRIRFPKRTTPLWHCQSENVYLSLFQHGLRPRQTTFQQLFVRCALCVIFMILVSLENVTKYAHVVAQLPQRLKSTLFEIFSSLRVPFGHPPFVKISNNVHFSL